MPAMAAVTRCCIYSLPHPPTNQPKTLHPLPRLYIHTPQATLQPAHTLTVTDHCSASAPEASSPAGSPATAPTPPSNGGSRGGPPAALGPRRRGGAGVPAVERHVPRVRRSRGQRWRGGGDDDGRAGDVRVRGLADGQRQQQRPAIACQGQLPALRHRLRRRAHRALLQRLHHGRRDRSTAGPAAAAVPPGRLLRRRGPPRRELRLRGGGHPGQHGPELRGADPVQPADQELRADAGPAEPQAGRRVEAGAVAGAEHLLRGDGQQRLPQQLPDAQLQHPQRVQRRPVLHAAGAAVRQAARHALQPGRPQVRHRRGRVHGVHPQHARAEPPERVLAGRRRPHRTLQQQGQGHGEQPQHQPPQRQVHLRRQLRHDLRGPPQPMVLRIQRGGPRVLRHREEPGHDHLPAVPAPVPEPQHLHLLGRLPPDGAGERAARQGSVQRRHRRRLPNEHPAAGRMAAVAAARSQAVVVDHRCMILKQYVVCVWCSVYKIVWSS